jgi:hypothetical protein
MASVRIYFDGVAVGSDAVMDWMDSNTPVQHTYDVIAVVDVTPGTHTIELRGRGLRPDSTFSVGAGSDLSILQTSATSVQQSALSADVGPFGPYNPPIPGVSLPLWQVLTLPKAVQGPAALLFSGRGFISGNSVGDAMFGISLDGSSLPNTSQNSWSVNDTTQNSELQYPFFSQGYASANISYKPAAIASVFPWWDTSNGTNSVAFKIGADATFVSIENPSILGAGQHSQDPANISTCTDTSKGTDNRCTTKYICVGGSPDQSGTIFSGCPGIGSRVTLDTATVDIQPDNDGVLQILAKTRAQGDWNDAGGFAILGISIDGKDVGFVGVQELRSPNSVSQRTISASYLADKAHPLSPGTHTIRVWGQASTGSNFIHLTMDQDLTLLFFD